MTRPVYVAGAGMTRIGRWYGKGMLELAHEALSKAVEDSGGLEPQAIVVGNMMSSSLQEQDNLGAYIAAGLGHRLKTAFKVEAACGSGGAAVYVGYSLVASGLADVVAVVGVEKMTDYPTAKVSRALAQAADADYELFYGATFAALSALMMRYYMSRYGVTRDEASEWPVMMHENALKNPYAQIRRRVTKRDVSESQVIADPIRLLDASPIGDGAAAVILASREAITKAGKSEPLVRVAGVGFAVDTVELSNRPRLDMIEAAVEASRTAYRMARVEPSQVDVVELHDAFTIHAFLLLEDLGFAEKGRAAKLVAEGRFRPGDKPTANPSGGLKARGHPVGATGVYQVAEIYMQLAGKFPGVKVEGAEVGVACNMGGDGASLTVVVLKREA